MQKIHVHNDFDVHLNFDNIKTDYVSRVEFWTRRDDVFCCCKCDGSLKVEDDSNIVCYLNDHNLGTGKLNYNVIFQIPDPNYNDGYKKVCQHYVSDIFLTSENGDTTVAMVKVLGDEEVTNLINRLSEFEKVFDNKQDKLAFDTTPTLGSKNVVYSDGIYNAIKNNKPDLSDYAKKIDLQGLASEQWVTDQGYITSIPDDYVTETELNSKGYLTEHQSLDDYVKKSDIPSNTSIETVTPSANTEYTLNSNQYLRIIPAAAVKLTFNKSDGTGLMRDYHILIDCKTAVPTTEFNEVLWELDNVPSFEKGKLYDIVIRDDGTNLYGSWKAYKLILMDITILIKTSGGADVKLNGTTYNLFAGDNSLTNSNLKTIRNIDGFNDNNKIYSIDFGGATIKIDNLKSKFSGMSNLTKIININIEDARLFSYMFSSCTSLTTLDTSNWDTSSATSFECMFSYCNNLTTLDISHFDTSSATNFEGMFLGCSGLTSLDVSSFNTSKATSFHTMFYGCSGLTDLDVSNWNVSSATDFSYMFADCTGLTSLDISGWNTSSATNFSYMFHSCSGLTSLDVSNWDVSKATDFSHMFAYCSGLTSLDVSNWDVSKATDFAWMFSNCLSLTSLDLSSWNVSSVTDFTSIFSGCTNLKTLNLSGWTISKSAKLIKMFNNCNALTTIKMIGCSQATIDRIKSVKPASATIVTE